MLSAAPGTEGGLLNPKRSAMATSRAPPTFTPSGANTELQETANALSRVPPHDSPPAFCIVKPSIVVELWIGKVVASVTMPACRAAVVVMIFIVEPGGWTEEKAIPASASIAPVRGFITDIPAYWPPSEATAARSSDGTIVVLTGLGSTGLVLANTRRPASSLPPSLPASLPWKIRSSPSTPILASAGYPSAA